MRRGDFRLRHETDVPGTLQSVEMTCHGAMILPGLTQSGHLP